MRNVAEIDLRALKRNAEKIKGLIGKNCLFCAVVKADAYGHGAAVVANAIYTLADFYAVALVEEGIELRRSGIDKPILVLTPPVKEDFERAAEFYLTLTIDSVSLYKSLSRFCAEKNVKIYAHIKYDTGMNRFGIQNLSELHELLELSQSENNVFLTGIYSHFARPENKKSLSRALDKFLLAINLAKGYNKKIICHISASGGLLAGVKLDMVRVGIMLYGYTPYKTDKITLTPVMKITAPVIATRKAIKGTPIFYGEKKVKKDVIYSVVRYGYADGLERTPIEGQINNRCMDVTAVETKKRVGKVTVLSDAEKLSKKYGTISYELLTKVAMRAEKRYRR